MNVIMVSEGEESDEEEIMHHGVETEVALQEPTTVADISLSSVVGITNPKIMKLRGNINGEEVIIMVDLGATNNFISLITVRQFSIPYSTHLKFGVTLGNGERIQGEGECKQLLIEVQGITICEDYLVLELGNSDIILGL
ncbi:unnamed protein product [Amaranthus hypochondriacus]